MQTCKSCSEHCFYNKIWRLFILISHRLERVQHHLQRVFCFLFLMESVIFTVYIFFLCFALWEKSFTLWAHQKLLCFFSDVCVCVFVWASYICSRVGVWQLVKGLSSTLWFHGNLRAANPAHRRRLLHTNHPALRPTAPQVGSLCQVPPNKTKKRDPTTAAFFFFFICYT